MSARRVVIWGLLLVATSFPINVSSAAESIAPQLAGHLQQGQLADAEKALQAQLATDPQHAQARYALGVVQLLSAIEQLGQDQYQYGALAPTTVRVPILRLPVPQNPKPEEITYTQVRQIVIHFQAKLISAEAELAKVDLQKEVKLPLDLLAIRLDLDGDGKSSDAESFQAIFRTVNRIPPNSPAADLKITFDNGDVPWLRGYCHLLCALCDMMLAYDHQQMFDAPAQYIYPRPITSQPTAEPLNLTPDSDPDHDWERDIVDAIAAIHLANFQIKEPQRMSSARGHLLEMIHTSRQSWELILAETDNDDEWLPNPKQTGVLRIPVTRELIDGWQGVLGEMEDLLEGRKLVPFWRDYSRFSGPQPGIPAEGRGVNLKKFYEEPPARFDLVLLFQGSAALPYIERGALSRPETWDNLSRVFGGQFFGFALWFN